MEWVGSRQDDKHAQNARVYRENFSRLIKTTALYRYFLPLLFIVAFCVAKRKTRNIVTLANAVQLIFIFTIEAA